MENNCNITDDVVSRMRYIVRRLTPTECERLTGLPDGYTIPYGLEVTDALVEEFREIWNEWDRITAPGKKPKSEKQVRAWLKKISNPETCPDSPRYKTCGNGWATNQPRWILFRMLDAVDPDWMDDYAGVESSMINTSSSHDCDNTGEVVLISNSNGEQIMPTISCRTGTSHSQNAQAEKNGEYVLVRNVASFAESGKGYFMEKQTSGTLRADQNRDCKEGTVVVACEVSK